MDDKCVEKNHSRIVSDTAKSAKADACIDVVHKDSQRLRVSRGNSLVIGVSSKERKYQARAPNCFYVELLCDRSPSGLPVHAGLVLATLKV